MNQNRSYIANVLPRIFKKKLLDEVSHIGLIDQAQRIKLEGKDIVLGLYHFYRIFPSYDPALAETVKAFFNESIMRESERNFFASIVSGVVRIVIRFAPLGVLGLVYSSCTQEGGFSNLLSYVHVVCVLVATMLIIALVINPLLVFLTTFKNPYPLVITSILHSGITAFFTRSSAANIPVNIALCERLGVPRESYSISIPLGCTINMSGAAVTIVVMTMAAVNTLGIEVNFGTSFLMCVAAVVCACGTSGIAGGSLMLIPLACSIFGISNDIAMQVVGIGFIIGVIQDSTETALNSSSDVVFTAAANKITSVPKD